MDKLQGNEREEVDKIYSDGTKPRKTSKYVLAGEDLSKTSGRNNIETKGTSPHEGWGTNLKPAMELWTLCRKPLSEKTIAKNVLKYGTGGINIDGCRVDYVNDEDFDKATSERPNFKNHNENRNVFDSMNNKGNEKRGNTNGRFPANFIHDGSDEVVGLFPNSKSTIDKKEHSGKGTS